jgi:hypothetical protein
MIKVHHLIKVDRYSTGLSCDDAILKWQQSEYELVAEVDCQFLEAAWQYTNHIKEHWWQNDIVTLVKKSRSSQVGDIFQFDKQLYMACRAGFESLNFTLENNVSDPEMILKSA